MSEMKFTKDEKVIVTYEGEDYYDAKYFSAIDENRSFVLIYEKPVKADNQWGMQVNVRCVKVSNDAIKCRGKANE